MCLCVCAVPRPRSEHVRKGVLNQRQRQEATAVTTLCLLETEMLNSMFVLKYMCSRVKEVHPEEVQGEEKKDNKVLQRLFRSTSIKEILQVL